MRVIFLGPPGAGKGTQAELVAEAFHIPKISTGDMLRQAVQSGSKLGLEVKKVVESGKLVSDAIIIALVKERIANADCQHGFLLDGFPRTLMQAQALKDEQIPIDVIIEIDVPDEIIVDRMSDRLTHPASGRVYHRRYQPPKIDGKDDLTGDPLIQREDDREETVRKRLAVYHEQTRPLTAYYQNWAKSGDPEAPHYAHVIGTGTLEVVRDRIFEILKNNGVYSDGDSANNRT